ncbi:hypothetical protein [Acidovorax sp. 100]|uniref:hypothetical protein n=1 Tax=Acidovorax sp. 100 TaxID=2135635 RepID=UPI0011C413BE|nr:hypothetical protein [Acidovorax sp. 100]
MESAGRRQATDAAEVNVVGALNMGSIVPGQAGGVVSPRFRFFSVCFAQGGMQRRRNIHCIRRATDDQKALHMGLAWVARTGLMG